MKKILYCMHVGWNWIEQRPHFIARELSKYYEINVISDHNYRVKGHQSNTSNNIIINEFYKLPMLDHWKFSRPINKFLRRIYYRHMINKTVPDVIYVMTPWAYDYIKDYVNNKIVVYDCMDDMIEFSSDESVRKTIFNKEKQLINLASIVYVSSNHLISNLVKRYGGSEKYKLIRNGYNGYMNNISNAIDGHKEFTIVYFGTIAEWFDFELIKESLKQFSDIKYVLYGPIQAGTTIPKIDRLEYGGIIKHDDLYEKACDADCLIMPFKLNPLIESVDPVKLYEYISFNKNILCVYYEEIERFSPFVYFYNNSDSFFDCISKMKADNSLKYSPACSNKFLLDNTWEQRGKEINKTLNILTGEV